MYKCYLFGSSFIGRCFVHGRNLQVAHTVAQDVLRLGLLAGREVGVLGVAIHDDGGALEEVAGLHAVEVDGKPRD